MAAKSNGVDVSEWARAPPKSGPIWERIAKAIYNPEDKSFLGRTPKRWGIVLVFYLVFYSVLAALFAACMGGLLYNLDEKKPMFILDSSLIGANPGVSNRPTIDGTLVVDNTNTSSYDDYVDELTNFFNNYKSASWYINKKGCKEQDNFGYPDAPCFFIKLNKIYGWVPEYHDVNSLPTDMPSDLRDYVGTLGANEQQQIWVSCADEASNGTDIEYPWGRGLPGRMYPYVNQDGYNSPVVAVRLTLQPNTKTTIRCRAWAKNIIYNKSIKEPSGYTRFTVYLRDNTSTNKTDGVVSK